jgi:hypothetical protein
VGTRPERSREERRHKPVREGKATGSAYRRKVSTVMRASYAAHYRRLAPIILGALEFRSNHDRHRPITAALTLPRRYAEAAGAQTTLLASLAVVSLEAPYLPNALDVPRRHW